MATASSNGLSSALVGGADTIVAVATGRGRSALAIVRVSGPRANHLAAAVCPALEAAVPRVATLTTVRDRSGELLETGVGVRYAAPRSYTGEDMLELTVHGSPYLTARIIDAFTGAGARPAQPGEFTRRAVANGKMDVLQAEAVRDLVAAETAAQLRNARRQLAGELSAACAELRGALVEARAKAEAALDFEGQGLSVAEGGVAAAVAECRRRIDGLLATAGSGARLRDRMRVAIAGPPNSGKSTFFNVLCGFSRSIVSPHPGTTRDVVETELEIAGRPVVVADTAGLRAAGNDIEAEGHRRALAAGAAADVVVWLEAVDAPSRGRGWRVLGQGGTELIRVRSKADLDPDGGGERGWLRLSCVSGEGVGAVVDRVRLAVAGDPEAAVDAVLIGARHAAALERARRELERCPAGDPEIAAENLRWASQAVAELVGEVLTEDVLDEIYHEFCIGK